LRYRSQIGVVIYVIIIGRSRSGSAIGVVVGPQGVIRPIHLVALAVVFVVTIVLTSTKPQKGVEKLLSRGRSSLGMMMILSS
jgi:hypothetical protein